MKAILLALICIALVSCVQKVEYSTPPKFKEGEVVIVAKEYFVVEFSMLSSDGEYFYYLHKITCPGRYCTFEVKESEISKP